jgi:hypothetical protein
MRWPQTTDHSHSLLCSAKSLRKRLIRSLTENNRLSSHQSKNRSFHSTETLNILVSDSMLDAIDKKMITALILELVYLSKTFDVGASSEVVLTTSCFDNHLKMVQKLFIRQVPLCTYWINCVIDPPDCSRRSTRF